VQGQEKAGATFELKRCYPYVVPKKYLSFQENSSNGLIRPLGHGLWIVLIQDFDGLVRNVVPEELVNSKISTEEAYKHGFHNLEKLLSSRQIEAKKYEHGPNNQPFMVVGEHWAAAACITLPGFNKFAQQNLEQARIVACIPHRDVMLLFPYVKNGLGEIKAFVIKNENDGRKPLTPEPFELTDRGPVPLSVDEDKRQTAPVH
jgi:hypothetical protein